MGNPSKPPPNSFITTTGHEEILDEPPLQPVNIESSITRLLEARQKERETQQQLDRVRVEYIEKTKELDLFEAEINKKIAIFERSQKSALGKQQEASRKIIRAAKRAEEEVQACKHLDEEIATAGRTMEELEQDLRRINELFGSYEKYKLFLESVVECSSEFSAPGDVISRHEALKKTGEQLEIQKTNIINELNTFKENNHCNELTSDLSLINSNKVSQLMSTLDSWKLENERLETQHLDRKRSVQKQLSEISTIALAVNDIYARLYQFMVPFGGVVDIDQGHNKEERILKQLEFIKFSLRTLLDIKNIA
ncbi:hypothetical protein P9112_001891 [Eukaryota sp. TZLM1-RC]